jgi:hypothetical protein
MRNAELFPFTTAGKPGAAMLQMRPNRVILAVTAGRRLCCMHASRGARMAASLPGENLGAIAS